MKFKCLACEALARLIYQSAAMSPHIIDVEMFRIGLHQNAADLRARLQDRIDATPPGEYDAIVLGYGLCGQSTEGLTARDIPLIIPRAHDCITLFLGGRARYKTQFEDYPGTYWYVLDYVERNDSPGVTLSPGSSGDMDIRSVYKDYVAKYGQDNADYLMEVMGAWQQHYKRAVYIDMGIGNGDAVQAQTQEQAARRGWTFERMAGDMILIRRLLNGDWNEDFLVLPPHHRIEMSYDDEVIRCVAAQP